MEKSCSHFRVVHCGRRKGGGQSTKAMLPLPCYQFLDNRPVTSRLTSTHRPREFVVQQDVKTRAGVLSIVTHSIEGRAFDTLGLDDDLVSVSSSVPPSVSAPKRNRNVPNARDSMFFAAWPSCTVNDKLLRKRIFSIGATQSL